MFIIGGNQDVCPRGFICINNYNLVFILLVIAIGIYFFNKQIYLSIYNKLLLDKQDTDSKLQPALVTNPPVTQIEKNTSDPGYLYGNSNNGAVISQPFNNPTRASDITPHKQQMVNIDRMVIEDPLYPPLMRNYHTNTDSRMRMAVPINIETRGSGGDFQQIGILSKTDISSDAKTPGNNTDSNILPLYGKPLYRGSSKWLYYTETDKYNPIKIPINVNNRDCTDDRGCDEISDGNQVEIPSYNGTFNVKIYKFNKPRYIPLENPKEILPLPFT